MEKFAKNAREINSVNCNCPIFFDRKKDSDEKALNTLLDTHPEITVVDILEDQVNELLVIQNPALLKNQEGRTEALSARMSNLVNDIWVYLPWRNTLSHLLGQQEFAEIRRSRNFNLIKPNEQNAIEKVRIGIAGLNVGNPAAVCMALEGVSMMKLADNDILSLSNLNRFRAGVTELGLNKAILSAYQIYESNPFAQLEVFPKGITAENIDSFLLTPRIDVLVEEMDNLHLKILIRERARKHGIPVVMVTGNGPNVIIDIERFDQDPELPLLAGNLKPEIVDLMEKVPTISFEEKVSLMQDFVGKEFLTDRLQESFKEVGKTLAAIPQLAESSFLRGASIAYVVRQIVLKSTVKSGRYYLKLENVLQ